MASITGSGCLFSAQAVSTSRRGGQVLWSPQFAVGLGQGGRPQGGWAAGGAGRRVSLGCGRFSAGRAGTVEGMEEIKLDREPGLRRLLSRQVHISGGEKGAAGSVSTKKVWGGVR